MGHLTLREAVASRQLDAFVQEQQDDGAELVTGSELERGLALLITQRRSLAIKQHDVQQPRPRLELTAKLDYMRGPQCRLIWV